MTDYKYDAPEEPKGPADQPDLPAEGKDCSLPESCPPELEKPKKCDPDCNCPPGPGKKRGCLEDLIEEQTAPITAGDKAKTFKADLEAFLQKANAASQEYTRDKHEKLLKQWKEEDAQIVELTRKLDCTLSCWRCVIECIVCPMLYDLRDAELRLFTEGPPVMKVHNLFDLLHWHTQEKAKKQRTFDRIKAVLAAWEKPAQTIEKALADDAKLIADIGKSLGSEPSKVVYDLFFKLIPLHLAIAPPATIAKTKIDKEYTRFCHCDKGKPEKCCGPNVGELSLRQRLIGPQPYLIDPNDYFKVICCLVDNLYRPAKDQLSQAEAWVTSTENQIKRLQAAIDNGLKTFDKDAKAAIPSVIDCDKYTPKPKKTETSYA